MHLGWAGVSLVIFLSTYRSACYEKMARTAIMQPGPPAAGRQSAEPPNGNVAGASSWTGFCGCRSPDARHAAGHRPPFALLNDSSPVKKLIILILTLGLPCLVLASNPREVAEKALQAWVAGDASVLFEISHPDLVAKMRTSRILHYHLQDDSRPIDLGAIPEWHVVYLFCEALRNTIPPRDSRFVYRDEYLGTEKRGEFTLVRFKSTMTQRGEASPPRTQLVEVLLKQNGQEWSFLWFPPAQIHIDLSWDPRPKE